MAVSIFGKDETKEPNANETPEEKENETPEEKDDVIEDVKTIAKGAYKVIRNFRCGKKNFSIGEIVEAGVAKLLEKALEEADETIHDFLKKGK